MWGFLFAFPSLYSPYNWAWSFSNGVVVSNAIKVISLILIMAGLIGIIGAMIWLGINRTLGDKPKQLLTSGIYKYSRNPQLASVPILFLGYILLRPTFYAVGWILLFFFISNIMIRSEEKHLQDLFGDEYEKYCQEVNRWILDIRRLLFKSGSN
jgi:protein-S-isoprenylcysteine O-methyltransferase Ste14